MFIRNLIFIFFIILISILQISFFSVLEGSVSGLNMILIGLVFILVFGGKVNGFIFSLVCGLIFDIYYFTPFLLFTALFLLIYSLILFLFYNVFTNSSLYSVLFLVLISWLVYNVLGGAFLYLGFDNYVLDISHLSRQLFLNLFASFFLFYMIVFLHNKINSIFLKN